MDKLVVVDFGHGGPDPGAVSVCGRYKEKDNVMAIGRAIHGLEPNLPGVQFAYTRLEDKLVDMDERVKFANNLKAVLFISVHQNADSQRKGHGAETFYFAGSTEGEKLARAVQAALVRNTDLSDRGVKPSSGLYVLRYTDMPAILVEAGFVGGDPAEADYVSQQDTIRKIAEGILMGVADYLGVKYGPQKPAWDPQGEINRLLADGVINTTRPPTQPVTWGELATVLNRIRKAN